MIVWQSLLLKVGRVMYVWFLTKTTQINVWLVCVLNQELSQVRPCVKYVSLKHGQNLIIFSSPGHRPCELLSWVSVRRPLAFHI
jgi:hypothetical protein